MSDLRYAARTLRNSPGFTATVVTLLALGIAANCAIFSVLDAVMMKRLAVRDPARLYRVVTNLPQLGKRSYMPIPFVDALRARATMAADVFGEEEDFAAISDPGPAEQIRLRRVTPNFFSAMGVNAMIGRVLNAGDADGAVVSYGFFTRRFAGDPQVIGRSITVANHRYTIVGVLPRDFNGITIDTGPEVRVLLEPSAKVEDTRSLETSIRLQPGVAPAQAEAQINSIRNAIESKDDLNAADHVELEPLEHGISRFRDRFSSALWFLAATSGLLLLMVCANVAGLLMARSAGRRQEIAVRLALGATRARLIRQMLTESLLLAGVGGALGIALAFAATPLVERALPALRDFSSEVTPLSLDLRPDPRMLAFSVLICAVTAILFGLAPAWQTSRAALHGALRSARGSAGWRGRQALIVLEVAMCTMLLAGAGLLIRTFERLDRLDTGFDRDHVVTFTVNPEFVGYKPEQAASLRDAWVERVRAMPGVESVAIAQLGVMRGSGMKKTEGVAGERVTRASFMNTSINMVSPEYFATMGMRLITGRPFTSNEPTGRVIVNEAFARHFFPNADPIGRHVGGGMPGAIVKSDSEIIGVVSDAKYRSLREPVPPVEYSLYGGQAASGRFILHVRTGNRPESIIAPVREALRTLDPSLPVIETHTLAEEVDASLWSERLTATLAAIFGAMAAALTAVGLYGLLAYAVSQRTREIGIRLALGAAARDIVREAGGSTIAMAAAGVAIGLIASAIAAPAIRSLLYEVAPTDPMTFAITAIFLVIVAVAAAAQPILRALRIDPANALRQD